jgi:hypothetical protein
VRNGCCCSCLAGAAGLLDFREIKMAATMIPITTRTATVTPMPIPTALLELSGEAAGPYGAEAAVMATLLTVVLAPALLAAYMVERSGKVVVVGWLVRVLIVACADATLTSVTVKATFRLPSVRERIAMR